MLGEIARAYKKDGAEQAVYQVKVQETRLRLTELRKQKVADARSAVTAAAGTEMSSAFPQNGFQTIGRTLELPVS
jgi:hypothetical protein